MAGASCSPAPVARGDDQVRKSRRSADIGAVVHAPGPQPGPGRLDLGLIQGGAKPEGVIEQVASGARRGLSVEPDVLLGRSDQDQAVVARHQVVRAMLDDPMNQRTVAPQQDDLPFEWCRGRADADCLEQRPRPGAGRHHNHAARQISRGRPDRRHPAIVRLKAFHLMPRLEPPASPGHGGHESLQEPRIANLRTVGQIVDGLELGVQPGSTRA